MPGSDPIHHHLVSRGLQNNFADDDKMVSILNAHTGELVTRRRSTKSNLVEDHFNSFITPAGTPAADLEHEWAKIESPSLERIRTVSATNADDDTIRAAVCEVFAMHLVRSRAYLDAHEGLLDQVRHEYAPSLVTQDETRRVFVQSMGREPEEGELAALVEKVMTEREDNKTWFVDSMARTYTKIVTMFANHSVQVIDTAPGLPGFILSDVPVVHAGSRTHRYGFRDGLAIGDADVIVGPLTRRTAVCLTAKPTAHKRVNTKKQVRLINAVFWRGAREVVACHPDDVREAQRVFEHLDDLTIGRLVR